jgi:molybdate transport system permease protein
VAGSIPGKTQTLSVAVYEAVQAGDDASAMKLVFVISTTCCVILLLATYLAPGRKSAQA